MNKETCEQLILDKLEEIAKIYREYNKDGQKLFLNVSLETHDLRASIDRIVSIRPYVRVNNAHYEIKIMEDIENE